MDQRREGGRERENSQGRPPLRCHGSREMHHGIMCFQGEVGCSCFIGQLTAAPNWLLVKFRGNDLFEPRQKRPPSSLSDLRSPTRSTTAVVRTPQLRCNQECEITPAPFKSVCHQSCIYSTKSVINISLQRGSINHDRWMPKAVVENTRLCLNCTAAALFRCWEVGVHEAWCTLAGRSREQHC